MSKSILLANDTSHWYHFGCTATSQGIKSSLEQLGYGVETLPITASYSLGQIPEGIEQFDDRDHFLKFQAANPEVLSRVASHDCLAINGEGTLHGLKPVTKGLLYLAYVAKTRLGKHVSIINHSCYPDSRGTYTPGGEAEALYGKVYQALDFIAVREPRSLRYLEEMGVSATLSFDCMPITIASQFDVATLQPTRKVVLAGCVAFNSFMLEIYAYLIETLNKQNVTVEVLIGAAANLAADDARFVASLSKRCPAGWNLVAATSLNEWLRCIGEAQLLVSGRFHHTIAAVCLGTPFITFESNTPKVSGIFELLGQEPPLSISDARSFERCLELLSGRFGQRHDPGPILNALASLAQENFVPYRTGPAER